MQAHHPTAPSSQHPLPPDLWWLECDEQDILKDRHVQYHKLLKLNTNRKPNSRLPLEFIGSVEHFTCESCGPKVTHDRVSIHCREVSGSVPGSPLRLARQAVVATTWDEDGLPIACATLEALDGRRRVGQALVALPLTGGGEDLHLMAGHHSNSAEEIPVWWCLRDCPTQQRLRRNIQRHAVDAMVQKALASCPKKACGAQDNSEDCVVPPAESAGPPVGLLLPSEPLDLDRPDSWHFPDSAPDDDDEEWSDEEEEETAIAPGGIDVTQHEKLDLQNPEGWVFPPDHSCTTQLATRCAQRFKTCCSWFRVHNMCCMCCTLPP